MTSTSTLKQITLTLAFAAGQPRNGRTDCRRSRRRPRGKPAQRIREHHPSHHVPPAPRYDPSDRPGAHREHNSSRDALHPERKHGHPRGQFYRRPRDGRLAGACHGHCSAVLFNLGAHRFDIPAKK
jgi:hypothetical protein